ncbi:hypothetical protein DL766_000916 [Monosporascus sp. MC13-8B]|uniref:Uncharacterized protein n=1 Tax=Monosporascus cannonballus TaxID=155416 RepID=A0ABY0HC89_9PEZI|nr:hypothetical protein DL762_003302 [Monosporascus cannonballus]RYP00754.1 hypothetical protein DL763_000634 [Monosporascus cannonballus]RYP38499.1 hypothetical protein DL766_000916 [Monosporascus sp. MC13-8B]
MANQGINTIIFRELRVDQVMQTFLNCLVNEKPDEVGRYPTQALDSMINTNELGALLQREKVEHVASSAAKQADRAEKWQTQTKNDSLAAYGRYEQRTEKLQHPERAHSNGKQIQGEYNALETKLMQMENERNEVLANPANGAGAPSAATDYVKENLMLTEKLMEADRKHDKDQEALRKAYDESGLHRMHLGHFEADILELKGLVGLYYGELEETKKRADRCAIRAQRRKARDRAARRERKQRFRPRA